jgi:hypothetical protein
MKKIIWTILILIGISPLLVLLGIACYESHGLVLAPFIMIGCILGGAYLLSPLK